MGNTAVLKPSLTAVHETYLMMKIWREAGGCSAGPLALITPFVGAPLAVNLRAINRRGCAIGL